MKVSLTKTEKKQVKAFIIAAVISLILLLAVFCASLYLKEPEFISPLGSGVMPMAYAAKLDEQLKANPSPTPHVTSNIDIWVDKYIDKYFASDYDRSYWKYMAHCLLLCESKHGADQGMGDNGKAGGIYQFHESTYIANRNRMINLGLVDHLGSRFDDEDAIETAVWMWSIGQENQWGPVLRNECGKK